MKVIRNVMSTLGDRIRECREGLGISQKALAERLGVHQRTIVRLENGQQTNMNTDLARSMANLFRCSLDWLLGRHSAP